MIEVSSVTPHDPGGRSKPAWRPGSVVTARFSLCGCYRWELKEVWDDSLPLVMWLLMNPSVAGLEHADPTLIKTGTFSRYWGFGGQLIGNVHAYRATDSSRLLTVADPVGAENDEALLAMATQSGIAVLAYGQPKPKALRSRGPQVEALLRRAGTKLTCLRLARDGTPCHPLYLPGSLKPTLLPRSRYV